MRKKFTALEGDLFISQSKLKLRMRELAWCAVPARELDCRGPSLKGEWLKKSRWAMRSCKLKVSLTCVSLLVITN